MRQLNLNVTPEFERDLRQYMKRKGIANKSAAIRSAVREAAARVRSHPGTDFRSLIGIALKAPLNPNPKFRTEDDLWS